MKPDGNYIFLIPVDPVQAAIGALLGHPFQHLRVNRRPVEIDAGHDPAHRRSSRVFKGW